MSEFLPIHVPILKVKAKTFSIGEIASDHKNWRKICQIAMQETNRSLLPMRVAEARVGRHASRRTMVVMMPQPF